MVTVGMPVSGAVVVSAGKVSAAGRMLVCIRVWSNMVSWINWRRKRLGVILELQTLKVQEIAERDGR